VLNSDFKISVITDLFIYLFRFYTVMKAIFYKPEVHGFDSPRCHWNFHWHNPSGRNMTLGLPQPLTEMSTRNIS